MKRQGRAHSVAIHEVQSLPTTINDTCFNEMSVKLYLFRGTMPQVIAVVSHDHHSLAILPYPYT